MNSDSDSEYLRFEREPLGNAVTERWGVYSKRHGDRLGRISWYGAWRQYTFRPASLTIWNRGCLADLIEFINRAMADRNEQRKAKPLPTLPPEQP